MRSETLTGGSVGIFKIFGVPIRLHFTFLLLLVFRPNLVDARPPPPPEDDWLARLVRRLHRLILRWLRRPAEPAVRVG